MAITSPVTQKLIDRLISLNPGFLGWGAAHQIEDIDQAILLSMATLSQQLAQMIGALTGQPIGQQVVPPIGENITLPDVLLEPDTYEIVGGGDFGGFKAPYTGVASIVVALSNGGILSMRIKNLSGTVDETGPLQDDTPLGDNYWQGIGPFLIIKGLQYSFRSSIAGTAVLYVGGQQKLV